MGAVCCEIEHDMARGPMRPHAPPTLTLSDKSDCAGDVSGSPVAAATADACSARAHASSVSDQSADGGSAVLGVTAEPNEAAERAGENERDGGQAARNASGESVFGPSTGRGVDGARDSESP